MNTEYKPSFALNYWRPWKKDSSFLDSWLNYNRDVSLVEYNAGIINEGLNEIGAEQRNAIDDLSERITGGFRILGYGLNNIYQSIQITNDRLESVIQTQLATNILLGDVKELLKIPEREKERIYHIESALKFLRKVKEDKDLYDDAYQEFKEAEKLKPQDYFILYNIGTIELYSEKHLDITSARIYFEKAAKYAMVDTDNEEYKVLNELFTKANNIFPDQKGTQFLSSCLLQAAFCCYILGDDENAFALANKAVKYAYVDSYYHVAKYSIRKGYLENAIVYINKCLKKDIKYLEKMNSDFDFICNPLILAHIKEIINDIENRFSEFELTYTGKFEFSIYREINEKLEVLVRSAINKFYFLQTFPESFISSHVFIENQNKQIEVKNKELDNLIRDKQNEIASRQPEEEALLNKIEILYKKIHAYQNFSENIKDSKIGYVLGIALGLFLLMLFMIIIYRFVNFDRLDEDDKNSLLLNPITQFFELLILAPVLVVICQLLGKSYYKGKYNASNSEYEALIKNRNIWHKDVEMIKKEIENLESKKQKIKPFKAARTLPVKHYL